jgi:hypothetical protein
MSKDSSYFAARAEQERRLAMASADLHVRRIHMEMAAEYAARVSATASSEMPPEPEQKTA